MSKVNLENAQIQLLFPKPIFSIDNILLDHLSEFEDAINKIMNAIPDDQNNKNNALNVASSFLVENKIHLNPVFAPLAEVALDAARNFMKEMLYDQWLIDECTFQIMWCNRSYGNDFIFPHNHGLATIAGVFYVKAPPNSKITFYDDMRNTRHMQQEYNYLTWKEFSYDCLPGRLILFRNEQLHGNTAQPEGEKLAISFNIGFK